MQRFISSITMIALLILIVFFLPVEIGLLFMMLLSFVATKELLSVLNNKFVNKIKYVVSIFAAATPLFVYFDFKYTELVITFFIVFSIFEYLKHHEEIDFKELSLIILSFVILPEAINSLTKLYLTEFGKILILIPMICAWGSDIFAYLIGKSIGKHKLAPKISPNKTIEGSVGGVLGGVCGMLLFGYFTKNIVDISLIFLISIGAFGAIMGQMGDLCFSMIKRQCGIKDYGKLIPGHGGVLDRFDSIIFTAPLVYYIISVM